MGARARGLREAPDVAALRLDGRDATRSVTICARVAIGVSLTFGAWAVIGFDGLTGYPDLLRRLSDLQSERSYSLVGMAGQLGLSDAVGSAHVALVGVGLLVGCVGFARRGDDARSFTCAVAATLALSPIVWLHYLVVLLVPLAILRPRFSALWLLPVLLWVSPASRVRRRLPDVPAGRRRDGPRRGATRARAACRR